jgi:hypothetical protein
MQKYKGLSKGEIGKMAAAAADQRTLTIKASIADLAAEVENDRRESVIQLVQAQDVRPERFTPLS